MSRNFPLLIPFKTQPTLSLKHITTQNLLHSSFSLLHIQTTLKSKKLSNCILRFSRSREMALEALNSPTTATPTFHFEEASSHNCIEPWTKRKRSRRPHNPPTEEEYLALCLIMLARGTTSNDVNKSASTASERQKSPSPAPLPPLPATTLEQKLIFKCSVCNKAFSSYQALGGHKAVTVKDLTPPPPAVKTSQPPPSLLPSPPPHRILPVGLTSAPSVTRPSPPGRLWADTNAVTTKAAKKAE